jgi:hypothetical protein
MAEVHAGDPAQAFEDLRSEVSVLRRAVEALPAAIRDNRPADYSADLAVLGKGLDEIGEQLGTILKSPAMMMSPEAQGQAIAKSGQTLIRETAQRLDQAVRTMEEERSRLAGIVGQAWAQDRQFKMLCWTGAAAFIVGLVLSPIVASVLPFGANARVAALVMRQDRWTAGGELMRSANPQAWDHFSADTAVMKDNREAIDDCRAALVRTGKAQRCTVILSPPETPEPTPHSK